MDLGFISNDHCIFKDESIKQNEIFLLLSAFMKRNVLTNKVNLWLVGAMQQEHENIKKHMVDETKSNHDCTN
jgi:hypothetical protein